MEGLRRPATAGDAFVSSSTGNRLHRGGWIAEEVRIREAAAAGAEGRSGGTNGADNAKFPRIARPEGREWCRFVECPEVGEDGEEREEELTDGAGGKVEGVVFKPIAGNAVFWENIRGDGMAWPETWHAGLPVKEGTKIGLNVWSWWQEG